MHFGEARAELLMAGEGIPNRGVSVLPGPRLEELDSRLPRSDETLGARHHEKG